MSTADQPVPKRTYDIYAKAEVVWLGMSEKESQTIRSDGVSPKDVPMSLNSYLAKPSLKFRTPRTSRNQKRSTYTIQRKLTIVTVREAEWSKWLRGSKSAEEALDASAEWVESF